MKKKIVQTHVLPARPIRRKRRGATECQTVTKAQYDKWLSDFTDFCMLHGFDAAAGIGSKPSLKATALHRRKGRKRNNNL